MPAIAINPDSIAMDVNDPKVPSGEIMLIALGAYVRKQNINPKALFDCLN